MSLVDWLLTEQLVDIFREAIATRPTLNAVLEARDPHGEEDVLAGAGTAVRISALDGSEYLVTPRRLARVVDAAAYDLVGYPDLIGYDWISPEMSEKVALKDAHYDRLYLYPRAAPPIVLDRLGVAVYPLMTFLGRVLEYQSQKVLLRKLDDDTVELLGRTLRAAVRGPFFTDDELTRLFGRNRESLEVVAGMWPRMNLAAPELKALLTNLARELVRREKQGGRDVDQEPGSEGTADVSAVWAEWIGAKPQQLETAAEIFRRVSTGEV